ncbi:hypothetical protein [Marinoscillum furvescens]|uniref:Uncharacterized protein n=1 Tax=Marinoscillum furvescens DSM 4134 TaxID=1122208 RepID=A0A3D9KYG8_MARFU|nr:hypothetical protein [Marinoscillum furvescens]RED92221.1 hypothetical protein C7460_13233 [Marinoscillum furvescens DSM 4134]
MDIGTIVIGLITVALCIIPFFLMRKSKQLNEQNLINGLQALADSYHCELAAKEVSMDFVIGISASNNYVFYYKYRNGKMQEEAIPLDAIDRCEVMTRRRTIKAGKKRETVYEKLELAFIPQHAQTPPTRVTFFDADEQIQPNGQLKLIRDWEARINEVLKARKLVNS